MKIVFCGGGTAGHITPNIAIIGKLKNHKNYYIGTNGMEKRLTQSLIANGELNEFYEFSAAKFQRKFTLQNLLLPFLLLKSVRQAKQILKKIEPDVVFGKGGYASLPVILAARSLKIPTIIHESDMTLGLANKISAHYANEVLTTYPAENKKYQCVGAIIREEILKGDKQKGLKTMEFDGTKPILLVMGGSLGAKALNDAICNCNKLSKQFDIFVICGKGKKIDCDFAHQAEFVTNIADVFAATDVCVTRGGSNALAELTLSNVPFVAVPLEKCSRGEQIKNANFYSENGCCMRISENNLAEKLLGAVNAAFDNRQAIIRKQKTLSAALFGTDKVVEKILSYEKEHA